MVTTATTMEAQDRTIVITRVFDAPRERVFEAWTEARHLARWFGPRDFTVHAAEAEVRVGGKWRVCIRSPEARDYWMHGVYREVAPPQRLAFTHVWEEGHGATGHETMITLTFEEAGGKTKMTFRKAVLVSVKERDEQHTGWSECFDRLGIYLGAMPASS